MTARPTGCARTSSSLAVSPKQAATLAHASGRCQWRWRHGQLAADAGVVARHTARHAWGYRMNTTTPPAARRGALIFIFVTVVLDMLAFVIIIPVLPQLVEQFLNDNTARAAQVYGVFSLDRKSTRLNSIHYCASRMPYFACKKNKNQHH